jgi:hypothetical protein
MNYHKIVRSLGIPGVAIWLVTTGIMFCSVSSIQAKTIHIDLALSDNCLAAYDARTRSCGGGAGIAYKTLPAGLVVAQPGDVVLLRTGIYGQLCPTVSGLPGNPITIKNYPQEDARIVNLSDTVALWVIHQSDLSIEGLTVENVLGFGRVERSTRITIQGLNFMNAGARGTTGGLKFVRSTYNRVLNTVFKEGNDSILLQDNSDYNLVEKNTFITARHSLMSIRCSNFNMIRNNTFANPRQKAVEIYDCEGISDAPHRLNATKRNVFEGNSFTETAAADREYRYNAIQHGAQQTIVRHNIFRNCEGGGVNYQHYLDESIYVYGNRLYNNTFYNNRCYAVIGNSGFTSRYYDNRVVNNLFYKNNDCDGRGGQTRIDDPREVILINNALAITDPQFVDERNNDFHLMSSSPYIDKGVFVTKTTAAGNGKSLRVVDAGYFYDGFGIPGETGDLIQLEGQSIQARIIAIDYASNILTLDQSLTWKKDQGVHLAFSGNSPDMGAFEYTRNEAEAPAPPNRIFEN